MLLAGSTWVGNPELTGRPAPSPPATELSLVVSEAVLHGCGGGTVTVGIEADIVVDPAAGVVGEWCGLELHDVTLVATYAFPGGPGSIDLPLGDRLLPLPALTGEKVEVVVDVSALVGGPNAPLSAGQHLDETAPDAPALAAAIGLYAVIPQ